MDLLAAWLLFPLALALLSLGCGLLVERLSGRRLPGVLLLPLGLAALMVLARVLVVSDLLVTLGLPVLGLVSLAGLVLARARLRALRPEPWAAAAAVGVALVIGAPVILTGEPTFVGSLVLGDTAHQLSLAARLGDAGTEWQSLPISSYSLGVRKYFATAYPLGPQAALGLLSPLGLIDLAWLYLPFLALLAAATALSLNGLLARWIGSRRGRALVCFVAAQPALVVAFALQGSIKEIAAVTMTTLVFALATLAVVERWPARAFLAPALAGLAAVGALGPAAVAYVGPPLLFAAGWWMFRLGRAPQGKKLIAAAAVIAAAVLLALPLLGGASTAVSVGNKVLSGEKDLGNLAAPLEVFQASGAWLAGDYRYSPRGLGFNRLLAAALGAAALLGLAMAVRRGSLGPLLLAGTLVPISVLLLVRGSPYADAKVLVLASSVVPLLAMSAAVWLMTSGQRRWRLPGAALAVAVGGPVLASNALAYHEAQLAPYERYEEQISIAEQLEGRGPVLFAEYDEFAKHFMRASQVLSQPEWPFEYPLGPLKVPGAATHVEENRDGLHPSFQSPLDPDGITPSTLQAAPYLVVRRSPTASRPPANYRLVRTGRYYEVWRRAGGTVTRHLPLGRNVFEPAARPSCRAVRGLARAAAGVSGARLAYVERPRVALYDPQKALSENRGGGFLAYTYKLYPRSVTVAGAGVERARLRVPRAGRYRVWIQGSFSREIQVRVDGLPAGAVSYQIANQGSFVRLDEIRLTAGSHALELERAGISLHPGNGGGYRSNLVYLGPVVLSPIADEKRTVRYMRPGDGAALCGRRLDWVEIVVRD
ncbi:MAG: hypothetical protein M3433_04055 [Actinomycetota bacterium]|nr:hypothetical protein [Actinomycetota bacterium]